MLSADVPIPGPTDRAPVAGILDELGQALRRIRDASRRRTRIGEQLFEALFAEYLRFAQGLGHRFADRPATRADLERFLALPLERAFALAVDYSESPLEFERLGRDVLADAAAGAFVPRGGVDAWRQAAVFLSAARHGRTAELPGAPAIALLLARQFPLCRHAVWGIVEPLRLYAEMRLWLEQCGDDPPSPAAVGSALAYAFDDWLARVPFDTWKGIPAEVVAQDLERLAESIFAEGCGMIPACRPTAPSC